MSDSKNLLTQAQQVLDQAIQINKEQEQKNTSNNALQLNDDESGSKPTEQVAVGPAPAESTSRPISSDTDLNADNLPQAPPSISDAKQAALDAANKAMEEAGDDEEKKAAAQKLLDEANAMEGGRRRSRRRNYKKSAKKSAKRGGKKRAHKKSAKKGGSKKRRASHRKH